MCASTRRIYFSFFTFPGSSRFERHYWHSWSQRGKSKIMMVMTHYQTASMLKFWATSNISLSLTTSLFISYWVLCRCLVGFLLSVINVDNRNESYTGYLLLLYILNSFG